MDALLDMPGGGLGVVWGRRRIGKTRLLVEWTARHNGLYTVADPSAAAIQRQYMAEAVAARFPGFGDVRYPDWRALLNRLAAEAKAAAWRGPVIFDELPYLAASSPELSGVLQRWIDHEAREAGLVVVLAGSSQRMMHGIALAASAPLFGRASQAFALQPLPPGYLGEALDLARPSDTVSAYAVWGGVPRYWELAQPYGRDLALAVDNLVLDPLGPLHAEPDRLLMEELPPAASLRSVLDAVGMGAHRTTEIAARIGQPATSLSRSLARLAAMGLLERSVPFGESERSGKRALYRIGDPFVRAWFRLVAPHRALLAVATPAVRRDLWRRASGALTAQAWEVLCRRAVPQLANSDHALGPLGPWGVAGRFWHGDGPEWDVVAKSEDGKRLLLGEAKWFSRPAGERDIRQAAAALTAKGVPPVGEMAGCEIVRAVFVPEAAGESARSAPVHVVEAATVLDCLRSRD